jgi:RNA polymerase sigma-70 factor (ECF subfamily)
VDDVMQEAALVALRRIVDVRDPEAVEPWLRMVVRNSCRTVLRAARRLEPMESVPLLPDGGTPEEVSSHPVWRWSSR